MKAVQVQQSGGPDRLLYVEMEVPEPRPGEVRVKIEAAGVNYIDIYQRRGLYAQSLPFTLGMEGGGVVDAVGEGVTAVSRGERVAYAMHSGAYADYAIVPAWRLVKVPDEVGVEVATAVMLQGMTAHYLTQSTYPIQPGNTVLVHAAAGGVGLLLVQLARLCGAHVIGTVSTAEKAALAREYGADDVILYSERDFVEAVNDLTGGQGVHVIYDGVGQATFFKGLDCLRPRGMMVLYGQASGPVDSINPPTLTQTGSLFLTRPSLTHYTATPEEIHLRTGDLFGWIISGAIDVRIDRIFPLREAASAHRYLEGRHTKGKLLLLPFLLPMPVTPTQTINQADPVDESSWESFPASDPPSY